MSVQTMPTDGIESAPAPVVLSERDMKGIRRYTGWNLGIAIAALSLGAAIGVLQGLEHSGLDLYPFLTPVIKSYYQGLTLHGVLNALGLDDLLHLRISHLCHDRRLETPVALSLAPLVGSDGHGCWLGDVGRCHVNQSRHGTLHLLRANDGRLVPLCGPDPGRGRLLDGDPESVPHLLGMAQGKPRR